MTDLTYADYIQTPALLSLQLTRTPDEVGRQVQLAEHFFIVAHQSCELWLKQIIVDLRAAADILTAPGGDDELETVFGLLVRSAELLRLLHEQVLVLERLPIQHFAEFRPYLGTASGAQSAQFRVLGALLGDDRRAGSLYSAFVDGVTGRGTTVAKVCWQGPKAGVLHRLAGCLLDVGNGYWRWKVAHVALVATMVGGRPGTGGTSGVDFLARRAVLPFPELRRIQSEQHEHHDPMSSTG